MSISQEKAAFEKRFSLQVKPIIILTANMTGGAGRAGKEKLWVASQRVIAYIDEQTGVFYKDSIRLEWQITDPKNKIFNFNSHSIYKILVKDELSPNNKNFTCCMLVDVIEKTQNQVLEEFLALYLKPVILNYKKIIFTLNKEFDSFEGYYNFLGKEIAIDLYCDDTNNNQEKTANLALDLLEEIITNQQDFDRLCRDFACCQLLKDAQRWQEDDDLDKPLLCQEEFINRINISSLVLYHDKSFEVFYDDDDIFWGHVIVIYGKISEKFLDMKLQDATIMG